LFCYPRFWQEGLAPGCKRIECWCWCCSTAGISHPLFWRYLFCSLLYRPIYIPGGSWSTNTRPSRLQVSPSRVALVRDICAEQLSQPQILSYMASNEGLEFSILHIVHTGSGAHPTSSGYQGLLPRGLSVRGIMLSTHLQQVPRSRKREFMHPFSLTSSWRSA
jgi:hypothetical protein